MAVARPPGPAPMMTTFFGTVQDLYTFFSGSTVRWEKLMSVLNVSLKGHCDTRWCSKAEAVNSLFNQIVGVMSVLRELSTNQSINAETVASAVRLLKLVNFQFLCALVMWARILTAIDLVNRSLQGKNISLHDAVGMLQGLTDAMQNIRDTGSAEAIKKAKEIAQQVNVDQDFREDRTRKKKRMVSESAEDESYKFTAEQRFKIELTSVVDYILSDLSWRYKKLHEVASHFQFLHGKELKAAAVEELQKHAAELAAKYHKDLNVTDVVSEVETFKFQASSLIQDLDTATPLQLLNFIHAYSLEDVYPNIEIALRLFLTLPVTVASCERSFSKLKLVKNYLRSSMGQDRLSGLSVISIEYDIARELNYDDVVDDFAHAKARKVHLL